MKRRSARAGGILSFLLCLVGFGIVAAMAVAYVAFNFATNVRVEETRTEQGKMIKVDTPLGSLKVNHRERIDPKSLGLPVYPGARLEGNDGSASSIQLDLGDEHKEFTLVAAVYTTPDSIRDVKAFYRKELPHCIITPHGFECSHEGFKRMIVLHRKDKRWGHTRIAVLASQPEPASN